MTLPENRDATVESDLISRSMLIHVLDTRIQRSIGTKHASTGEAASVMRGRQFEAEDIREQVRTLPSAAKGRQ